MKLSDKILIGFFGLVFLYFTAAFTELRVRGVSTLIDDENSTAEIVDITGVDELIVTGLDKRILITGSDKSQLEVRSLSGDLLQKLQYSFQDGKLHLQDLDIRDDEPIQISIYVPSNSLRRIISEGTFLSVNGLNLEVLDIQQDKGWVTLNEKNHIRRLQVESVYGNFVMNESTADTLVLAIRNADVTINSPVRSLDGIMSDTSYLRMYGVDEIRLKKDESSTIYLE